MLKFTYMYVDAAESDLDQRSTVRRYWCFVAVFDKKWREVQRSMTEFWLKPPQLKLCFPSKTLTLLVLKQTEMTKNPLAFAPPTPLFHIRWYSRRITLHLVMFSTTKRTQAKNPNEVTSDFNLKTSKSTRTVRHHGVTHQVMTSQAPEMTTAKPPHRYMYMCVTPLKR